MSIMTAANLIASQNSAAQCGLSKENTYDKKEAETTHTSPRILQMRICGESKSERCNQQPAAWWIEKHEARPASYSARAGASPPKPHSLI